MYMVEGKKWKENKRKNEFMCYLVRKREINFLGRVHPFSTRAHTKFFSPREKIGVKTLDKGER